MATEPDKRKSTTIHGDEKRVELAPTDPGRERFYRTGRQVIEHCELGISLSVWLEELESTLTEIVQWATARAGKIRACYCSPDNFHVTIFVSPNSDSFDFELAEELAELNANLLRRFNIGNLEVHQIPWAESDRFIDFSASRRVYGELPSAPTTMDAQP